MTNNKYLLYFNSTHYGKFQSPDISARPEQVPLLKERCGLPTDGKGIALRAVDRTIECGATVFRREIMLPRLIPIGPADIADHSAAGRWRVVRRLAKALRGERTRGRSGHWTYSLNRHIGLLQAFRAERTALRSLYPAAVAEAHTALMISD